MTVRRPPQTLPPMLQWLLLVPLLLFFALVLVGSIANVTSSVPDEATLVTLEGRLDGLRVGRTKDGALAFTMEIQPAAGDVVTVHMQAFGLKDPTAALNSAEGQPVVVRYRKGLLGNPAYAIAGPEGAIITFADARRFLEGQDAAKGPDKWGGLVLYGLGPLLLAAVIWRSRRTQPVADPAQPEHSSQAALAHTLARSHSIAGVMWLLVMVLIGLGGVPADVLRVFGARPFGLPPLAAFVALTGLATAPLAWGVWHLMVALATMQHCDGILRTGKLGIARGLHAHWDDPNIRSRARRFLAGVAGFLALMAAWMIASA